MSIKNLIEKCGKENVINLLPSLFITIDTEKIEKNQLLCDNDYFVNPQQSIDALYNNLYLTDDYEKMVQTIYDIAAIDKAMVDSVIITYLGKSCVRYKNKSEKHFGKSLYLDVHAVRIALTDMQTEQTICRFIGNGFKLCVGAFLFSVLHKHTSWNLHFFNLRALCFY